MRPSVGSFSTITTAVPSVPSPQKEGTRSPHGPLAIPCENCHTSAGWKPIRAVPEFDHNKTKYPLRGLHEKVQCTQCHLKPVFTDVGKNCADCHADIHRRQMGSDCAQCHTVNGWEAATQQVKDHQNRFPLFGAHAAVPCESCHKQAATGIFLGLSTRCDSCHLQDWQKTTNPPHPAAGPAFASGNCQGCHSFDSWLGAKFDHSTTGFLLTNGHANLACTACHINNNYNLQIAPTACGTSGCHLTTWQQTNNPPHPQAGPAFATANCSNCHNTVSWTTATFDHSSTGFLLTNGHANVACTACHINNNYNLQIAPSACGTSGCHLTTWQQTTTPMHSTSGPSFGVANCANCHTTQGWNSASFDHSSTGFALVGTHLSPSPTPCASCHVNNNYSLTNADCMTCHTKDWNSTQTLRGAVPNHITAGFPSNSSACSTCHTITKWADGKFDHSATGFLLTNGHANVQCAACHINGNYNLQIQPTDCGNSGCHLTTWQQTNNPVHSSSGPAFAAANCAKCHTTVGWDAASFDHSITGWPLTGTHLTTACAACHVNNNYTLTSANTDCYGCHQAAWTSTQTLGGNVPNHVTAGFSTSQCSSCHDTTSWTNSTFNHTSTGFPLTNSHQMAPAGKVTACAQCHINNNYALNIQPTDCGNSGCHLSTWQTTNNPVHPSAGAPFAAANCSTCHNTITWTTATFDHSSTGWPLTGSHQLAPAGKVAQCTDCHVNNNYTFTSANTDCYGCHQAAWTSTQTLGGNVPNHVTAGFPTAQCSTCHDTISWLDGKFDHSTTGFPLTNSHQMAPAGKVTACAQCHINNNYALNIQPTDCGNSGCHLTTWQTTNNPVHPSAGAPFAAANCSTCHNTITWTTATFDHSTTGWPLTGSHQLAPAGKVVNCTDCHVNNNYSFTSANTNCFGCHQAAWTSTQTLGGSVPNHVTAGFPTSQCSTCHDTVNWADGKFDHSTTGFPLTNSHQLAPAGKVTGCAQCHINNNYTLKIQPTDCGNSGCHLSTWQTTTNPVHPSAGAPFAAANCSTCHNTITWTTATFDHSTTGWPLTGSHQLAPAGKVMNCTDCHVNNNYTFTAANTDCYGCHQTAWTSTQTLGGNVPNHITAGFPTSQCSTCHDTVNWADGKFDHATTGWALTGAHTTTACALCHVNGNYSLTSANTACYGCHVAQWNSTQTLGGSVPNHIAAGYPTTCDTCHTTTAWTGATFNHTYFPIPHHGSVCNDCHQVSTDYSSFTCIACHTQNGAHAQASTDNKHNGVGGYSYGPTTCYNCHKNGGG